MTLVVKQTCVIVNRIHIYNGRNTPNKSETRFSDFYIVSCFSDGLSIFISCTPVKTARCLIGLTKFEKVKMNNSVFSELSTLKSNVYCNFCI